MAGGEEKHHEGKERLSDSKDHRGANQDKATMTDVEMAVVDSSDIFKTIITYVIVNGSKDIAKITFDFIASPPQVYFDDVDVRAMAVVKVSENDFLKVFDCFLNGQNIKGTRSQLVEIFGILKNLIKEEKARKEVKQKKEQKEEEEGVHE
ncbi:unnamed protein product [Caenorhabditis bovis]|uniref:Uncharacterized protein n=1 Tax=Caenorhabditis bovis TaxID=2654633 RepID=A0A8S1FEA1_9PELO|nr:unnamed protein product [Caenorhabditis bovis]